MSIIEIRDASKSYVDRGGHALEVLRNVNLQIFEGEFLSILGVSGCGKSTLLNVMGGFEDLTFGEALFRGDRITGPSAERGVCFQEYALFPWKTVRDNVEFGLRVKGLAAEERHRVSSRFLEMVGLLSSEHKYPHELSGGMRQRCSLARTFANDPAVLLMDEPLAAVDAQTRLVLQSELMNIWGQTKPARERKTIVYITHSIEEAVFLSDRVAVMAPKPGRIAAIVDIGIPRPRNDQTRRTQEFRDLTFQLYTLMLEHLGSSEPSSDRDGFTDKGAQNLSA